MSYAYYYDTNTPVAPNMRSASLNGFTVPSWMPFRSVSNTNLAAYPYAYNYPYVPQYGNYVVDQNAMQLVESRVREIETQVSREPIIKRELVNVPGPMGRVKTMVARIRTPQPDVIERTFVIKPQKDQINVIIEKPATPVPRIVTKQVVEDPGAPNVTHKIVRVPPRSSYYQYPVYQQVPVPSNVQIPVPSTVQVHVPVAKSTTRNTFNTQRTASKVESKRNLGTQSAFDSKSILSTYGAQ
jgi:hypothetical protein